MKDNVYKLIELTGTSTASVEDAVDKAIKRAIRPSRTVLVPGVETRGSSSKGKGIIGR